MIMNRLFLILSSALLSCGCLAQNTDTATVCSTVEPFVTPAVPESLVFAGETICFDTADLYERMDRELIAFTYSHTNSILMLKRAGKYFPIIEPILKEYGIPDDMKYLAVIESNLDPTVVSAVGAAGMWQFMKDTGKSYGLEITATVDERYNIEKATRAACKYLKSSYAKFGEWLTVAASYNAGSGSISKRIELQKQDNALDLWLVNETSRYIFRLMTAKLLFENPQMFGFDVTEKDRYKFIETVEKVTVTESIPNLADFALLHGVTYAQLKRHNLWLRDSKLDVPAGKSYVIEIPAE